MHSETDTVGSDDAGFCRAVLNSACEAKETLTEQESVVISLKLPNGSDWQGQLSREHFNELIENLIKRTLVPCRRALRDAGIRAKDIENVVMVGWDWLEGELAPNGTMAFEFGFEIPEEADHFELYVQGSVQSE